MGKYEYDDLEPCSKCGCSFENPGFCEFAAPVVYRMRFTWYAACDNCEELIHKGFGSSKQAREAWNALQRESK